MIHPLSDVQSTKIGQGTNIWQFSIILPNAIIGEDCNINCHVFIENDVIIGNHVTIKTGVQIWDGLRIGNYVFIGPNVTFTNDLIPRSKNYSDNFINTIVDDGASIGANATILAGVTIGKNALIGAGSVITKNVPQFTIWYGNPATLRGYISLDNMIIDLGLKDKKGNQYEIINGIPNLLFK
jgi:UDP-2-acetamido-3-amino-2,3-dideoxy-glucuronate N-acetyltransferase